MKNILLPALVSVLLLVSCQQEKDPYLIDQSHVGKLDRKIRVNQLNSIYKNDSIVRELKENQSFDTGNEIRIYDREGSALLLLEPVQTFDSTSTIGYIRVLDPRYKTTKGLNLNSTFKDIVENYQISRIENTLNSAVVFIDELGIYITIDKKELPSELRFDTESVIRPSQIPDDAKIKYFMIGWD